MPFLEWKDQLSVKIDVIDKQHQVLVKWMNNFYDAKEANNHIIAKNALENLIKYSVMHFEDEERMMIKAKYSDYESHKKIHTQLLDLVTKLSKNYFDKPNEETADVLAQFLKKWLTNHIMGIDRKYTEPVINAEIF